MTFSRGVIDVIFQFNILVKVLLPIGTMSKLSNCSRHLSKVWNTIITMIEYGRINLNGYFLFEILQF